MKEPPAPPGIAPDDWAATPAAVRALLRPPSPDQAAPAPLSPAPSSAAPPEDALEAILASLTRGLRLPYAAILVNRSDGDGSELAAETSPAGPADWGRQDLPLLHDGQLVGRLVAAHRRPDDPLTPTEQALLVEIARRAGSTVHLVRLTRDLRRTRERLVLAREEERRRLRRDLHDSIGPTLAALNLKAGALRALILSDPDAAARQMTELREQIRLVITDIRRVVYNLRPPALDELGMLAAIREQAAQFSSPELTVSVNAPETLPPLPAAVEVAAYRIVLEALTNVARHAQARRCTIRLQLVDGLSIEVLDDGLGLPGLPSEGVGLASMRERAAELGGDCALMRPPGGGTLVRARLPLNLPGVDAGRARLDRAERP